MTGRLWLAACLLMASAQDDDKLDEAHPGIPSRPQPWRFTYFSDELIQQLEPPSRPESCTDQNSIDREFQNNKSRCGELKDVFVKLSLKDYVPPATPDPDDAHSLMPNYSIHYQLLPDHAQLRRCVGYCNGYTDGGFNCKPAKYIMTPLPVIMFDSERRMQACVLYFAAEHEGPCTCG